MNISLEINRPSGEIGFVEYGRGFTVEGNIKSDISIPDNARLYVELSDIHGQRIRFARCNGKNKPFPTAYEGLLLYPEGYDDDKKKLLAFGFPPLAVDDINNPDATMKNATVKAFLGDVFFKAIIISATDTAHGAICDDGMNFTDENGLPYSLLPKGEYVLSVTLLCDDKIAAQTKKKIIIGTKENRALCRFNPESHKKKAVEWAKKNGYAIITDTLPGYLEPYLGKWLYHMGLMKMFRANDIPLLENTKIHLFVYGIDEESTTYSTELAYLQTKGIIEDITKFVPYRYDIGESEFMSQSGRIIPFGENEFIAFYRVDTVTDNAAEGRINLDGSCISETQTDMSDIRIKSGTEVAFNGVIRPMQSKNGSCIICDDNRYTVKDYPKYIKYTFISNGKEKTFIRDVGLTRIENGREWKSVFEFMNIFKVSENTECQKTVLKIVVLNENGEETKAKTELALYVY